MYSALIVLEVYIVLETAPDFVKDTFVHYFEIGRDCRRKGQEIENMAMEINAGCYFRKSENTVQKLEYAALGNVKNSLFARSILSGEGNRLNVIDEFVWDAFFDNAKAAIADFDFSFGCKCAAENNILGSGSDVNESAAAGDFLSKLADVVVAEAVNLTDAETGEIKSSAVYVVEHICVRDKSLDIK